VLLRLVQDHVAAVQLAEEHLVDGRRRPGARPPSLRSRRRRALRVEPDRDRLLPVTARAQLEDAPHWGTTCDRSLHGRAARARDHEKAGRGVSPARGRCGPGRASNSAPEIPSSTNTRSSRTPTGGARQAFAWSTCRVVD
jgi:hypothetical protein